MILHPGGGPLRQVQGLWAPWRSKRILFPHHAGGTRNYRNSWIQTREKVTSHNWELENDQNPRWAERLVVLASLAGPCLICLFGLHQTFVSRIVRMGTQDWICRDFLIRFIFFLICLICSHEFGSFTDRDNSLIICVLRFPWFLSDSIMFHIPQGYPSKQVREKSLQTCQTPNLPREEFLQKNFFALRAPPGDMRAWGANNTGPSGGPAQVRTTGLLLCVFFSPIFWMGLMMFWFLLMAQAMQSKLRIAIQFFSQTAAHFFPPYAVKEESWS